MLWFIASIVILLAFLIYMFPIIQVCGDSMYPTLKDGDLMLGCRLFSIETNSIYVYRPPVEGHRYVIKRLTVQLGEGKNNRLFFEGDNPEHSYDSRMYGFVSRDKVVAKCLFIIHRRKESSNNERSK